MMKNRNHLQRTIIYLLLLALLVTGSFFTHLFDSVAQFFEDMHLRADALLRLLIMALLVLSCENLVLLFLSKMKPKTNRGSTIVTLSTSLLRYLTVILIICWGLTLLGVDVSTVVASVGILALVIGFGAESLIADVVTGVFMLFENQYNVGDIVEVGGFRGTVRNIGIRSTSIEDAGGNLKIMNNASMTNILNRSSRSSRAVCTIGIPYETDLEALEARLPAALEEIYERNREVFHEAPVYRGVESLDSSAVTLLFTAAVSEENIFLGNRVLNRELFLTFRRLGVELPYTQIDVHSK
ncbi:MAG: mechanosensitive ion channel family protein [Oscillospiraceae bacterium]|nr:mechanosensitive ion channel family protein [Oscillospiraceae bacterium]